MNIRNKATFVGIFISATLIVVIMLLFLFAIRVQLTKKQMFVMRFSGNLKGVHVGTDVEYRGIKVGEVAKIKVIVDPKTAIMTMPIWVRFLNRLIIDKDYKTQRPTEKRLRFLVKKGLRAQLQGGNLITGDKVIALVLKPNAPVKYYYPNQLEIPTIPTQSKEEVLLNTLYAAQKALNSVTTTMKTANKTLIIANKHLDPIAVQIVNLLKILQKAGYHVNVLTEYLSRHPESFIAGKHKG